MDKKLYLSVENEGLRQCINTLRTALKVMRRNFDTANRKLRSLTREHSKCPDKRKIMFLYRWLSFIISGFCCEGHINATSFERQECLRHLDEFIDYIISNFHEIWNILRWSHFCYNYLISVRLLRQRVGRERRRSGRLLTALRASRSDLKAYRSYVKHLLRRIDYLRRR